MDELSLMVDDSIVADPAESASSSLPSPDFTGSLDYIDSLASRRALALSQRDALAITTGLNGFDYLSPLLGSRPVLSKTDLSFDSSTDFRPLGDARRFNPERATAPLGLVRSSSQVVSPSTPYRVPPGWRNPLDPTRSPGDIERSMRSSERRIFRHPLSNASRMFSNRSQVVICLKRKIRRNVLGALGFPRMVRIPRRTYWSRVIC